MSKVRGVSAASSQIKFELPLDLITACPCGPEHGQMRPRSPESAGWFGNFNTLFPQNLSYETLSLPKSTRAASGREERNAVSVLGKRFGLRSKRSVLFRAADDLQRCFLFQHKDCFEALELNKFDLVVQMAQMTIFPSKKGNDNEGLWYFRGVGTPGKQKELMPVASLSLEIFTAIHLIMPCLAE